MDWSAAFFRNCILSGLGYSLYAFAAATAIGLAGKAISKKKHGIFVGTFFLLQLLMPLAGWLCVHKSAEALATVCRILPWVSFLLLAGSAVGTFVKTGTKIRSVFDWLFPAAIALAVSLPAAEAGFSTAGLLGSMVFVFAFTAAAGSGIFAFLGISVGKATGKKVHHAHLISGSLLLLVGVSLLIGGLLG